MPITAMQIAQRVEEKIGVKPTLAKNVINALVEIAQEELNAGNEFTVPGLVKISFRVTKPIKKGTMVRNPFDGTMKPHAGRPAGLKPAARPLAKAKAAMPSAASKVGKAIIASKK